MNRLVVTGLMLVVALMIMYGTHLTLMDAEKGLSGQLRSMARQRLALSRYETTQDDKESSSVCHTRVHLESYAASNLELPDSLTEAGVAHSRQHGGSHLHAGRCFGVGDYGLLSSDHQMHIRVTNVGQIELVVADLNVTIATWPATPVVPQKVNNGWTLCLQLDGNLCLANADVTLRNQHPDLFSNWPNARCWSSMPATTTKPLDPHDRLVMRGHQDLCLQRSNDKHGLDTCIAHFWTFTPTPDQRLIDWFHQSLLDVQFRWMAQFGLFVLLFTLVCFFYIKRTSESSVVGMLNTVPTVPSTSVSSPAPIASLLPPSVSSSPPIVSSSLLTMPSSSSSQSSLLSELQPFLPVLRQLAILPVESSLFSTFSSSKLPLCHLSESVCPEGREMLRVAKKIIEDTCQQTVTDDWTSIDEDKDE
jgi:hypothetical protein